MAISSAFKSAYTNEVNQQNQGINTITSGVKDVATVVAAVVGFPGLAKGSTISNAMVHTFAGRVGGVGGNIMLASLQERKDLIKAQKQQSSSLAEGLNLESGLVSQTLGENPINRNASKQLSTVFEKLGVSINQGVVDKQGMIDTSLGKVDINSPLGNKIVEGLTTPEKSFMLDDENVSYFNKNQLSSLQKRGVTGDSLLNANDLAKEILDVGGEITKDGKVRVFHATTPENAKEINRTGQMFGKEDKIYFSTKRDGVIKGYGNAIVEAEIPIEKLKANDLFTDEIHLTMDTGVPGRRVNIREGSK